MWLGVNGNLILLLAKYFHDQNNAVKHFFLFTLMLYFMLWVIKSYALRYNLIAAEGRKHRKTHIFCLWCCILHFLS